jgi:hypothetical protein
MSGIPETRYAKSGDDHVAYQVMGEGPFDLRPIQRVTARAHPATNANHFALRPPKRRGCCRACEAAAANA